MDNQSQNDTTPGDFLTFEEATRIPLFYTPEEAEKSGIKLIHPVPEVTSCEFCNAKLQPIGRRRLNYRIISVWSGHQECQCEGAAQNKERLAAEEAERIRQEEEMQRKIEQQNRVKKLFDQSKLGARFISRTFENFEIDNENQKAFETAKKYAENFEKYKQKGLGLNFNGAIKGTGKTHLAAAITIELINQGIPVIMGNIMTLLGKVKQTYENRESEQSIIDLYSTVDLLVIDDIGKERVTEWTLEKLYQIINNRYENNLPIIITSNFSIDGLTERLIISTNHDTAEAITSRLWEMCPGVECNWKDRRKEG
jgi:DNA replication protein DnaC